MANAPRSRPLESQRIALHRKIILRFPDFDGFVTEYSANLSMTGMFVRSLDPHPPGTPVSFEFKLTDGMDLIGGTGWVVWTRTEDEGEDQPAGMGIEFSEISADSRRLIRWIILHQLPEGERPFNLAAYDDKGHLIADQPPVEKAAIRNVVVGAVAAIAVFGLAAGGIYLLLKRESPVAPQPAALPRPAAEAAPAEPEPERPVTDARDAVPPPDTAAYAAAEAAVLSWAEAWSNRDVEAYLEFYATGFEPQSGASREAWEQDRRARIEAPQWLRVALTDLQLEAVEDGRIRALFNQAYRSDTYSDLVRKALVLERHGDAWKIVREEVL